MAKTTEVTETIITFNRDRFTVCLVGTTGLYFNRMSKKAREQLLTGGKRDRVEMKHDMIAEFRDSPYINRDSSTPALFHMPAGAFKSAIADVTIDMGKAIAKAKVERLVRIVDEVMIYGVPYMRADVVRSADINKTPDIRTRAFLPEWCAKVTVDYVTPALKRLELLTLFANAGLTIGVGDGRQQKGARDHGLWELVGEDDADFQRILKSGGRREQEAAMEAATPYDEDTKELLAYFHTASRAWVAEKAAAAEGRAKNVAKSAKIAEEVS